MTSMPGWKESESGYEEWLSKQSLPVKTLIGSLQPAALGIVFKDIGHLTGGPFILARNMAAVHCVNAALLSAMKYIRGKQEDDLLSFVVSGFGSGATCSLLCPFEDGAISTGLMTGIAHGIIFQLKQKFTKQKEEEEDVLCSRTTNTLGLHQHVKNFNTGGLFTDNTSALQIVKASPGRRLLTLDQGSSLSTGIKNLCLLALIKYLFSNPKN